jgi:Protein of unknown function (DUF3300)
MCNCLDSVPADATQSANATKRWVPNHKCSALGKRLTSRSALVAAAVLIYFAPFGLLAQPEPDSPAPVPVYYPADYPPAPDPLDELMGPVALYPDPIISILLPASSFPSDIQAAASYLNNGGDPGQVDGQPWDQSVRSLAHYPDVVKWMAQNSQWTQSVGAAFVSQPAEIMEAIQRLRELARAAGTLASNPQQQVFVQGDYVEIEPAQPNLIFIPRYDPQVVYVDQPYQDYNGPFFTYGAPYQAGIWLTFGCNWGGSEVVVVDRGYWRNERGWRQDPYQARVSVNLSSQPRPWGFPSGRPRPQAPSGWRQSPHILNVRSIAGAPPKPPASASRLIHTRGASAVAVVSRNPATFKGQPLNTSIIKRGEPTSAPQRGTPFANKTQPSAPQHSSIPIQDREPTRTIQNSLPTTAPHHVVTEEPGRAISRPAEATPLPTRTESRTPTPQERRTERTPEVSPNRVPVTPERTESVKGPPQEVRPTGVHNSAHEDTKKEARPAPEKPTAEHDTKDDPPR